MEQCQERISPVCLPPLGTVDHNSATRPCLQAGYPARGENREGLDRRQCGSFAGMF